MTDSMLAQGTHLRILAALAITATAAVAGGTATVTDAAHGLATGDRIAIGDEHVAVTRIDADTFSFPVAGTGVVAGPISYKPLLDIAPKTFSGPGGAASVIDATNLSSTAKRKRVGLKDEGQMTFTVNYTNDNAAHLALRAARANNALADFELEFEDGTVWTFGGYVLQFQLSGSVDGLIEGSVSVEIDGEVTEL